VKFQNAIQKVSCPTNLFMQLPVKMAARNLLPNNSGIPLSNLSSRALSIIQWFSNCHLHAKRFRTSHTSKHLCLSAQTVSSKLVVHQI
jgi:hypothetical protein